MNNEQIDIEIDINETITTSLHVSDVMYALNRVPLIRRWNAIGNILTHLNLSEKDEHGDEIEDEEKLTASQKELVKNFLKKQLDIL